LAEENIEAYIPVSTSLVKVGSKYFSLCRRGLTEEMKSEIFEIVQLALEKKIIVKEGSLLKPNID